MKRVRHVFRIELRRMLRRGADDHSAARRLSHIPPAFRSAGMPAYGGRTIGVTQ